MNHVTLEGTISNIKSGTWGWSGRVETAEERPTKVPVKCFTKGANVGGRDDSPQEGPIKLEGRIGWQKPYGEQKHWSMIVAATDWQQPMAAPEPKPEPLSPGNDDFPF